MARFVTPPARNAGAGLRTLANISSRVMSSAVRLLRRLAPVAEPAVELAHQFLGGFRNHGAGREDRLGAGLAHGLIILRRGDGAHHDHEVGGALPGRRAPAFW